MRFAALAAAMFCAGLFVTSAQQPASSANQSPSWESLPDAPAASQPQQQATNAQPDRLSVEEVVQPQSGQGSGGSLGKATAVAVTTYSDYQPVGYLPATSGLAKVRYVSTRGPIRNTVRAGSGIVRRVASLPVRIVQNVRSRRAARASYYAPQYVEQIYQPQVSYTATGGSGYQARWTHPSTIQDHMASDHGIITAGKSTAQLLAEHDAIHDQIGPVYTTAAPRPKPTLAPPDPFYAPISRPAFPTVNNCPNGKCPLPRRDCR